MNTSKQRLSKDYQKTAIAWERYALKRACKKQASYALFFSKTMLALREQEIIKKIKG